MNKVRLCGFIFLLGNVFSVLFAGPRVITLEGDVIEGNITLLLYQNKKTHI